MKYNGKRKPKQSRSKQSDAPYIRLAGDIVLTTVCTPVEDNQDVNHITRDMMAILKQHKHGVGLSANQAGYLKRIIIVRLDGGIRIFINPKMEGMSVSMVSGDEGCLSYPGVTTLVTRPEWVLISSMGQPKPVKYSGRTARIILHEIDHLDGICRVGGNV